MNVQELHNSATLAPAYIMCGKCEKLYHIRNSSIAEDCCKPSIQKCIYCQRTLGKDEAYCAECREFNQVKAAKHIMDNEYEGRAVFTEHAPGGREGYYFGDDLTEQCDDGGVEPPCYVYACTPIIFELNLYEYVSSKFCEHVGEDELYGFTGDEQLDSLHKELNEWATKQPVTYEVDTGLVVVLDNERFKRYLQKNDKNTCLIN